jgi:Flp pilus assembly protein TadG
MRQLDLARLMKDRGGNFGIMTAILLPVLVGAAGVAIDVTNALQVKSQLQGIADGGALATASAMADKDMTASEAQAFATKFFLAQASQVTADPTETPAEKAAREAKLKNGISATASTTSSSGGNAQTFDVGVKMSLDVPLTGLSNVLGLKTMKVSVNSWSQSGREGNALSMYLALDESGSMAWDTSTVNPAQPTKRVAKEREEEYYCSYGWRQTCTRTVTYYVTETNYLSKMAPLKAATAGMFAELKKADPTGELIRMGADSYDDQTKAEQAIKWGTTAVATYVGNLPNVPDGGTDASGAMSNAFNALKTANATERREQANKKNTSFERFIVLMTDGEMTGNSSDWNSVSDKKVRNLCKQAKDDGIKVYTIAFMAPDRGKALLNYCASGEDYYYDPEDMTSLVQSFGDIARKAAKRVLALQAKQPTYLQNRNACKMYGQEPDARSFFLEWSVVLAFPKLFMPFLRRRSWRADRGEQTNLDKQ